MRCYDHAHSQRLQQQFAIGDAHGHFQEIQPDQQRNQRNQDTVPHDVKRIDVNELAQYSGKSPHENDHMQQKVILDFLEHGPKVRF